MLNRFLQTGVVALATMCFATIGYADDHESGDVPADETAGGDDMGTEGGGDDTGMGDDGGGDMGGGDEGGDAMGGDEGGDAGGDDMGAEGAADPHAKMWMKGALGVNVDLGLNMSADLVGKPFSIAPDVWYVVAPKVRLVVAHSAQEQGGFYGQTGATGLGVCLAGEDNGCFKVYDNFAIGADYAALMGDINVVPWGRVQARSLDGGYYALIAGAKVSKALAGGKLHVGANPNIGVGLTKRDEGNKEYISVPVSAMYAVMPALMAGVQTGIQGFTESFGDNYTIPVAVGGMYHVNSNIHAGLAFNFLNIAGKNSSADFRALSLMFGWTK